MIEIKDNFLGIKEFDMIQDTLMGNMFPWYYNPLIDFAEDKDKYQFTHIFFEHHRPTSNQSTELMAPLLIEIGPLLLWRIKANLLTKTSNIIENEFHVDIVKIASLAMVKFGDVEIDSAEDKRVLKQLTTSIFYVNTNNGYTKFKDGTKVESVANRLVSFPSDMKHKGTSCTDEKIRIVINFNYFKLF